MQGIYRRKRLRSERTVMILCIALLLSAGAGDMAFAAEPDDENLSERESDYDDYEVTDEDIREIKRSVSESNAAEGTGSEAGYRSIKNPELKVSYDAGSGSFIYRMPNGGDFTMNVPLGGITDEPVDIKTEEETWIEGFLEDGVSALPETPVYETVDEALSAVSEDQIIEVSVDNTGSYDFLIRSGLVDKRGVTVCTTFGSFRIARTDIPIWTNVLNAPYGYEIRSISVDGRNMNASGRSIELSEDGTYEVVFKPQIQGLPEWTSAFTRDTTAPVLTFSPALTGETMDCPVSFTPSEQGAGIRVYLNNKEIRLQNMTAAADGNYRIEVFDALGNENVYSFRIDTAEKAPVTIYLYILLFITALSAFVIVTAHGRMRII